MSLSRYKWNARFGELRAWLSQPTWTQDDLEQWQDWLWFSLEKFNGQFFDQAVPYIQGHPNAKRLKISLAVEDVESMVLARALPGAHLSLRCDYLAEQAPIDVVDVEDKIMEVHISYFSSVSFTKHFQRNLDLITPLHLNNLRKIHVGVSYSFMYEDPFDPKFDKIAQKTKQLISTLLDNMGDGHKLESLFLANCGLDDDVVLRLASMRLVSLKVLILNGNRISDESAFALAESPSFHQLEKLSLSSDCEISERGRRALLDAPHISNAMSNRWFTDAR